MVNIKGYGWLGVVNIRRYDWVAVTWGMYNHIIGWKGCKYVVLCVSVYPAHLRCVLRAELCENLAPHSKHP